MRNLLAAAAALLAVGDPTTARPVSYPGGWTLMQDWNPDMGSLLLHYTPSRHWSLGMLGLRMREGDWTLVGPQATWLVHRWNRPASQANLYLSGGAGAAVPDSGRARPGGFARIQGDWEDRRFMVMGMAQVTHGEGIETADMQMVRAGFAPYVAGYGGVHLWLFGQVRRDSASPNRIQPAFVARVFYRTILLEAGVTGNGQAIVNSTFRF
ncbi:MAG: hypothetical protein SNJ79_06905 [Sphingomonadaceae bacterium]